MKFKIGDRVRLKKSAITREGEEGQTAIIKTFINDDGGVMLDQPIGRFYCWNVQDLVKVTK